MTTNLKKLKFTILVIILFLGSANLIYAQNKPKIFDPGGVLDRTRKKIEVLANLITWTNQLIYSAQAFQKVTNMNTADFNKNVTVVKADTGTTKTFADINKTIPPKKITYAKIENDKFTNLNWEPAVYFDSSLFPSAIISMRSYKKVSPDNMFEAIRRPLGFNIISDKSFIPLKYEIECGDKNFFDKVTGYIVYKQDKKFTDYNVDIPWNNETLMNTWTPKEITVYFRLFDENGTKVEKSEILKVRSIDDCISQFKQENLNFMYSAYVQEENIKIESIKNEALNTKVVSKLDGYSSPEKIDMQVEAIWIALNEQGFSYNGKKSISTNNSADTLISQTVKTCNNVLKTKQANSLDGTILFASILKYIGINPLMIITKVYKKSDYNAQTSKPIEEHCLLAYATTPEVDIKSDIENGSLLTDIKDYYSTNKKSPSYKDYRFLETTLVQNKTGLSTAKTSQQKSSAYRNLFNNALHTGIVEITDNDPNYVRIVSSIIDVSKEREKIASLPIY